jgi:hypothetical protein
MKAQSFATCSAPVRFLAIVPSCPVCAWHHTSVLPISNGEAIASASDPARRRPAASATASSRLAQADREPGADNLDLRERELARSAYKISHRY